MTDHHFDPVLWMKEFTLEAHREGFPDPNSYFEHLIKDADLSDLLNLRTASDAGSDATTGFNAAEEQTHLYALSPGFNDVADLKSWGDEAEVIQLRDTSSLASEEDKPL